MSNTSPSQHDAEISVRGIVIFSLGLVAVVALAFVLVWGIGAGLDRQKQAAAPEPGPFAEERANYMPPAPNLQADPTADWDEMLVEEELSLNSYQLLDASGGQVQLPIEEAMRRVVEEGAPEFGGGDSE